MNKSSIRTLACVYITVASILSVIFFAVKDWGSMDFLNLCEAIALGLMGLMGLGVLAAHLVTFHLNLKILADDINELKLKTGTERRESMYNILGRGVAILLCNGTLLILILNLASTSGEDVYSLEWWVVLPVILTSLATLVQLPMLMPLARKMDAAAQSAEESN